MSNEVMPNFFTDTFSFTINNKSATIYATQALVEVDSYSTLKIVSGKLKMLLMNLLSCQIKQFYIILKMV